jgi:hypothetical protein
MTTQMRIAIKIPAQVLPCSQYEKVITCMSHFAYRTIEMVCPCIHVRYYQMVGLPPVTCMVELVM